MKEYLIHYKNFRGRRARAIIWAHSEREAREDFWKSHASALELLSVKEEK